MRSIDHERSCVRYCSALLYPSSPELIIVSWHTANSNAILNFLYHHLAARTFKIQTLPAFFVT